MYPATPTLMPIPTPGAASLNVGAVQWKIWTFADDAVGVWNEINRYNVGTVIQLAIIVILLAGFVWLAREWFEGLSE